MSKWKAKRFPRNLGFFWTLPLVNALENICRKKKITCHPYSCFIFKKKKPLWENYNFWIEGYEKLAQVGVWQFLIHLLFGKNKLCVTCGELESTQRVERHRWRARALHRWREGKGGKIWGLCWHRMLLRTQWSGKGTRPFQGMMSMVFHIRSGEMFPFPGAAIKTYTHWEAQMTET